MNALATNNAATDKPPPDPSNQFQRDLIALIPYLRAFSRVLCGRKSIAEDMAQDALAKAWRARDRFEPGTNLRAWLFTILRNEFYSHSRRAWRETHWDAEKGDTIPGPADQQDWAMELSDTVRAFDKLTDTQREAVILVGAGGFSYGEAAAISGTAVGTVKSRVARGRASLLKALSGEKLLPRNPSIRASSAYSDLLAESSTARTTLSHRPSSDSHAKAENTPLYTASGSTASPIDGSPRRPSISVPLIGEDRTISVLTSTHPPAEKSLRPEVG